MKIKWLLLTFTLSCCMFCGPTAAQNSKKESTQGVPIHLTQADFLKKVVDYQANPDIWKYLGDKPCVIDFYANWCGPCRRLAPVIDELAKEYSGQIYFYKINTDEQKELAGLFNIRSIPTLLFVPIGAQPQLVQGALPKESLVKIISEVLLTQEK